MADCNYTAVELEQGNVEEGMQRLPEWVRESGFRVEEAGERGYRVRGEGMRFDLCYEAADALDFLKEARVPGPHTTWLSRRHSSTWWT